MRYLNCVPMVLLIAALAAGQPEGKQAADFQSVAHLVDYAAKQPIDIHDKIIEESSDSTLHDITYTSPKGRPLAAYLVLPKGKGPFAAVLFGHWGSAITVNSIRRSKSHYVAAGE